MARSARALGLPTIRHVMAASREQKIRGMAEMSIREGLNTSTGSNSSQVKDVGFVLGKNLVDLSIDPQTSDSTIREHSEANVGEELGGGDLQLESVAGAGVQSHFGEDRSPLNLFPPLGSVGDDSGEGSSGSTSTRSRDSNCGTLIGGGAIDTNTTCTILNVLGTCSHRGGRTGHETLHRDKGGVVSRKEGRIDLETCNRARVTQLNYAPT